MPELPEVETTLNGIKPYIERQKVTNIVIRHSSLRWPIPTHLRDCLMNQMVVAMKRRGKYILMEFKIGTLILHLGMSGRVRILKKLAQPKKHDHVDIYFSNNYYLRFTDPRRFGAILWIEGESDQHPLLKNIGPEPLTEAFNANYLYQKAARRTVAIKNFIMNSNVVAGVGNIYATEALHEAHIHPLLSAGKLTLTQCETLVAAIKQILQKAIKKGGTTLKDFLLPEGSPGYFSTELMVYGRGGEPCKTCGNALKSIRIGQRSTVFCERCQKNSATNKR